MQDNFIRISRNEILERIWKIFCKNFKKKQKVNTEFLENAMRISNEMQENFVRISRNKQKVNAEFLENAMRISGNEILKMQKNLVRISRNEILENIGNFCEDFKK